MSGKNKYMLFGASIDVEVEGETKSIFISSTELLELAKIIYEVIQDEIHNQHDATNQRPLAGGNQ